ncbi:hypothetical protein COB55_05840 [Candidatus Wolfebacteria bacterium]|nr:MAG: hypothetical protein COB55_05840 [Candidatus Wolfebacteria bacterium]
MSTLKEINNQIKAANKTISYHLAEVKSYRELIEKLEKEKENFFTFQLGDEIHLKSINDGSEVVCLVILISGHGYALLSSNNKTFNKVGGPACFFDSLDSESLNEILIDSIWQIK